MSHVVTCQAKLRQKYAGLSLGYRVLNLDGTEYSPFTRAGVIETQPACYTVLRGVEAPETGGRIVWGEIDRDLADAPLDPAPQKAVDYGRQLTELGRMIGGLRQAQTPLAAGELAEPTMKRIGEMVQTAIGEHKNPEVQAAADQVISKFAEIKAIHDESASIVASSRDAIAAYQAFIEHYRPQFDEVAAQMRHTATELSQREFVPPVELERLTVALGEFVEAMSAPAPDSELRTALGEFVEAIETETEPQMYSEHESVAMMEAAARILARGEV